MPTPDQYGNVFQQVSFYFSNLFETDSFPKRWFCGSWSGFHGWSFLLADILTFLSYFGIPIFIFVFLKGRKQSEIPFRNLFNLAALFIMFCGLTHLFDSITFWFPMYRFLGLLKIATAGISFVTLIALMNQSAAIFKLKTPTHLRNMVEEKTLELKTVNLMLSNEIEARKQKEEELADLLSQNENLLREMHHRVKNNLQTINSMIKIKAHSPDLNVKDLSESIERRVFQMSKLHDLLLKDKSVDNIDLKYYLGEVLDSIRSMANDNREIQLVMKEDIQLPSEVVLNLGMIVSESCTNSLKYAFDDDKVGNVWVEVETLDGLVRLKIADDGKGFDKSEVFKEGGFGSLLIHNFTGNINKSKLEITSDSNGTVVEVSFPITQPKEFPFDRPPK